MTGNVRQVCPNMYGIICKLKLKAMGSHKHMFGVMSDRCGALPLWRIMCMLSNAPACMHCSCTCAVNLQYRRYVCFAFGTTCSNIWKKETNPVGCKSQHYVASAYTVQCTVQCTQVAVYTINVYTICTTCV